MVVLIKIRTLHRELFDLAIEGHSLYKPFEVLAVIKCGFEKAQALNYVSRFAELNESLDCLLEKSALFEPKVNYAEIWGTFNRE